MGNFSGRRAFRVIREVQITRVELAADVSSGEISTPGHKEPLHGWGLAHSGRVVSIEEVALPDEATIAQAPHIEVEYVHSYMSHKDDGIYAYIPLPLIEIMGSVEAAFELCTDEDRSSMVYHDESLDELYTAEGSSWEGDEEEVYLLPGHHTDLRKKVMSFDASPEQDAVPHTKYRVFLAEQGIPAVVVFSGDEPDRERFVSKVFHTRKEAELALFGYRLLNGEMLSSEEQAMLLQLLPHLQKGEAR